jgi:hypothetical protein
LKPSAGWFYVKSRLRNVARGMLSSGKGRE